MRHSHDTRSHTADHNNALDPSTDTLKLAPHSIGAEQSVLGAILLDPKALGTAQELLSVLDFYRTAHQRIYGAMLELFERGVAVDNLTLTEDLKDKGILAQVGGAAYLAELVNAIPSSSNVVHHARIVAKKARLRTVRNQTLAVLSAIEAGEDAGRLSELVKEIAGADSISAYRPGPLHESNFKPMQASELLAEVTVPTEWILEDYLATGSLALIAGKPKEGKTTLIYELAVRVAQGQTFLGRTTRQGGVLILAVEEHQRDVKLRLQNLGAEGLDGLYVHVGALSPTPTFFAELLIFIRDHGILLVVIDTLAAFWSVENENDASEMTRAVKPVLQLARESDACVLLIHHARKSEGSHGDEIRGSGALFGLVDVALVMKRGSVETQRLLQAQSRYPETPSELVLDLRESGYVALGDPASVGKAAKKQQLIQVLPEEWEKAENITKRAGLTRRAGYRLLDMLVVEGIVLREGQGKKSDPYRFKKNSICAPPLFLGVTRNTNIMDSIRAAPGPPAQTELEDMEAVDLFEEGINAT